MRWYRLQTNRMTDGLWCSFAKRPAFGTATGTILANLCLSTSVERHIYTWTTYALSFEYYFICTVHRVHLCCVCFWAICLCVSESSYYVTNFGAATGILFSSNVSIKMINSKAMPVHCSVVTAIKLIASLIILSVVVIFTCAQSSISNNIFAMADNMHANRKRFKT